MFYMQQKHMFLFKTMFQTYVIEIYKKPMFYKKCVERNTLSLSDTVFMPTSSKQHTLIVYIFDVRNNL